ncbi:DivIVA domain-containing protein [Streptomyces sp. F63]|uniref:DivIVA domain-containing protein n=1 Tax=Streptomyces sp. F63 TaxID=2824887 RepID=UPI0027DE2FD3|nr:DivIVA domain-containing protein [Streptomyces sp. F63]
MFWFLLIALVVVVAAVALAVVGDDGAALPDAEPDRLADPLPLSRPVGRADVEAVRFPVAVRGYRMTDVDDVLGRLGAELAERDARIAELETALAGARAAAFGAPDLFREGTEGEQANGGTPLRGPDDAAPSGPSGDPAAPPAPSSAAPGDTAPAGRDRAPDGDGAGDPDGAAAAGGTTDSGTRPAPGGGRPA